MPRGRRQNISIALLFGAVWLLRPITGLGTIITYTDQTFSPTNWSLAIQTLNNGGSASGSQLTNAGNPLPDRQVNISVNGGTYSEVYAYSLTNQAVYQPSSQGAIQSVSFQEDINTTGAGQQFGPALLQDGIYYYDPVRFGPTTGWVTASASSLTASSFGTDLSASSNPNFSAGGDPITFGFVSINNTAVNGFSFSSVAYYDNWSVSITTNPVVPEPTSVLIISAGALLLRRRRR